MTYQKGYIFKKGRSWFGRWREDAIVDGQIVRRQRCEKLADYDNRHRTAKDVRPELDKRLRVLNQGRRDARCTLAIADFAQDHWLPWVRENCKPSTVAGYERLWNDYLAPRLGRIALEDFRTVHAAELLAGLHSRGLGRNMLKHSKSLLVPST